MDRFLKKIHNEHSNTLKIFSKIYNDLLENLDPSERDALFWIRRGLRSNSLDEKQMCYQKVRQILGDIVFR
mgnify:CR=1 FL=1